MHRSTPAHQSLVALAAALLLVAGLGACSSSPADTADDNGLRPGTYEMVFAIPDAFTIPEPLRGQHNLSFRVADPALSPDDVTLVSSRRSPPESPAISDYLELDRDAMVIDETRWALRFRYRDGPFSVAFTVRDAGFGNFRVPNGCLGQVEDGASYQGSGCRLDRR